MKWRSSNTKFKNTSLGIVNDYLEELESIKNIKLKGVRDEQLKKSFENIKELVFKGVKNIKINIDDVLTNAEWDKLNIALFGETNAGKSTILEVLSNGAGDSIGYGRKDFTQTVHIHKDKSINIIDMPGIEGKESTVIDSIKEAVNKSHVILYVIGTNKEPEETTIRKIKEMLHDNTEVYTIINIRGRVSQYKRKLSKGECNLVDENIRIVEERVQLKFSEILGEHYITNINVQAHLALLANEKLNRDSFNSDQTKALDVFKTKKNIKEFSEIDNLNGAISDLNSSFNDKIRISNVYKFLGLFEAIEKNIYTEYINFETCIENLETLTNQYVKEIKATIKKYKGIVERENKKYIKDLDYELKNLLSTAINNDYGQSKMDSEFKDVKDKSLKKLNKKIESHMMQMKKELLDKLKEFEEKLDIGMKYFDFDDSFDFETVIDSLKVDFKYVIGQMIDVGLTIAGVVASFVINPFLGIATLIVGIARKFFDWVTGDSSRKKREAYSKGSRKIESLVEKIESKLETNQSKLFDDIDHKTKVATTKIQKEIKIYSKVSNGLSSQLSRIEDGSNSLIHYLLKDLLGPKVEFSYLDLESSQGLIVGYEMDLELMTYLERLLRLKKIHMVTSMEEWDKIYEAGMVKKLFYKKSVESMRVNNKFSKSLEGERNYNVAN